MKKFLLSIALVALALSFTSCGDDEPYVPQITNETVIGKDLINSTVTLATNSVTYIETADYTFDIEYRDMREATVKVVAKNVKFDSHMPYPVTFAMEPIKTYQLNDQYVRFISSKVKFLNPGTDSENTNYTLTNVIGYIDKRNKVFTLTYTVNDKWKVIVTSSTIRSRIAPGNDYTAPTELYYIYKIDIATKKAEVFLHNIQFTIDGASSPVLKKISIPDLNVTPTAYGFDLSGDNIVPYNFSGANLDQATPMPRMVVTNYSGKIDILEGMHTIFFNSMGGEWDGFSGLYLWEWKGAGDWGI